MNGSSSGEQTVDEALAWAKDIHNLPFQFEPDSDRVVIVPDEEETESADSFQYSKNTKGDINHLGTVISVGPGSHTLYGFKKEMRYAKGDRVMYSKYAGDDLLLSEGGQIRPYIGSVITGSLLIKIVMQDAILGKLKPKL